MDIPRYALIAASVLLGLMLLGEWTRFSTAQQEVALPAVPMVEAETAAPDTPCLLYTSPSPRDYAASRMPSSA